MIQQKDFLSPDILEKNKILSFRDQTGVITSGIIIDGNPFLNIYRVISGKGPISLAINAMNVRPSTFGIFSVITSYPILPGTRVLLFTPFQSPISYIIGTIPSEQLPGTALSTPIYMSAPTIQSVPRPKFSDFSLQLWYNRYSSSIGPAFDQTLSDFVIGTHTGVKFVINPFSIIIGDPHTSIAYDLITQSLIFKAARIDYSTPFHWRAHYAHLTENYDIAVSISDLQFQCAQLVEFRGALAAEGKMNFYFDRIQGGSVSESIGMPGVYYVQTTNGICMTVSDSLFNINRLRLPWEVGASNSSNYSYYPCNKIQCLDPYDFVLPGNNVIHPPKAVVFEFYEAFFEYMLLERFFKKTSEFLINLTKDCKSYAILYIGSDGSIVLKSKGNAAIYLENDKVTIVGSEVRIFSEENTHIWSGDSIAIRGQNSVLVSSSTGSVDIRGLEYTNIYGKSGINLCSELEITVGVYGNDGLKMFDDSILLSLPIYCDFIDTTDVKCVNIVASDFYGGNFWTDSNVQIKTTQKTLTACPNTFSSNFPPVFSYIPPPQIFDMEGPKGFAPPGSRTSDQYLIFYTTQQHYLDYFYLIENTSCNVRNDVYTVSMGIVNLEEQCPEQ